MSAPGLPALAEAGLLSPLDRRFAETMARLGAETREAPILAAAMASRALGAGHVCLALGELAGRPLQDPAGEPLPEELARMRWPELEPWLAELLDSPLVMARGHAASRPRSGEGPEELPPLVLDVGSFPRLYLRRYWEHERALAEALDERAGKTDPEWAPAGLEAALAALFGPPAGDARDDQRLAALAVLRRPLAVITGGPGSGKTYTVARALALLAWRARARGERPPRVALLAPTGKAAARLAESLGQARLAAPGVVDGDGALPPYVTATIHRHLGATGREGAFRHGEDNPLPEDAVFVDEASMVDAALLRRLVSALRPDARLVLLGDRDQLVSVEAGAILGDICGAGLEPRPSRALATDAARYAGVTLDDASEGSAPPIADCVVALRHSWRFRADSGIGGLARAVQAGDAECVLALLDDPNAPDLRWLRREQGVALPEALRAEALAAYAPLGHAGPARDRLAALGRFRILCAHRAGPGGVEDLNARVRAWLETAGALDGGPRQYDGRPILVLRNDYGTGLYNGDGGLLLRDPEGGSRLLAAFPAADRPEGIRLLSPARLPPHETVYAMSIHKSQGSEFDEVLVSLPARSSPILSRELLYTAVTRARQRVTVLADEAVLREAVARRVERSSGLRDALWGPDA